MKEELIKLLDKAYAPYSNFHVACIIEMNDGKFIPGVNVENASYGATICAERSAIVNAISHGVKKCDFKELHVMVKSEKLGTPCFVCRQVISEFFNEESVIKIYSSNDEKEYLVKELCPYPFSEENL